MLDCGHLRTDVLQVIPSEFRVFTREARNLELPSLPMAEDGGFEPPRAFTQHAFQACALGRYANPPDELYKVFTLQRPDFSIAHPFWV